MKKRITSCVLVVSILCICFGIIPTSAAEKTINSEVLYMNTFGYYNSDGAPAGMMSATEDGIGGGSANSKLIPWTEADGEKSALDVSRVLVGDSNNGANNGAHEVIPFGKVIKDGKIHVSMDFYKGESYFNDILRHYESEGPEYYYGTHTSPLAPSGRLILTLFNTNANSYTISGTTYRGSGEDLNRFYSSEYYKPTDPHQLPMVYLDAAGSVQSADLQTVGSGLNGAMYAWNNIDTSDWCRLDIIVDVDAKRDHTGIDGSWEVFPVDVYANGIKVTSAGMVQRKDSNISGFKGMGIYRQHYVYPGWRYDNIYVSHYYGAADPVKPIVSIADDKRSINVAFSEYLKNPVSETGFSVVRAETGEEMTFDIAKSSRSYTLTFASELPEGKYFIRNASAVGAISKNYAAETTSFFVSDSGKAVYNKTSIDDFKGDVTFEANDVYNNANAETINVNSGVKSFTLNFSSKLNPAYTNGIDIYDENGGLVGAAKTIDGNNVIITLDDWFTAGKQYKLSVFDGDDRVIGGHSIFLNVAEQPIYEAYDTELDWSTGNNVKLSTSLFNSIDGTFKNTMLIAAYDNAIDADGNEYQKLVAVKTQKLDISEKRVYDSFVEVTVPFEADIIYGYIFEEGSRKLLTTILTMLPN